MKILKPKNNSRAARKGAALVEAAMVMPMFFLAIVGIIEFGRGMMVSQLVTNASREAARRAIFDGSTNADVDSYIGDKLSGALGVQPADVTVNITITPDPRNNTTGNNLVTATTFDLVTVEVVVPFDKVSFFAGHFLKGNNLRAETTMRHE